MPISSEILKEVGIVLTVVTGDIDDDTLINFEINLAKHPDFDPQLHQLIDASGVINSTVTPAGLQKLVEVTPFAPARCRAFVTASDEASEKAGIFAKLASASQSELIYVTRNRDDAYNWLMEKCSQ